MFRVLGRQVLPQLSRGSRGAFTQTLAEPMAWNQANAQVTTLPNGVRVATKESHSELASVGVFVGAGVRDETRELAGATHLVEQLALNGTAKRSRDALAKEVEGMGGLLNVSAGREQTSYTLSLGSSDLKQGVDILSDMVLNPGLDKLVKEKEGILRTLENSSRPNRDVIDDRLHTTAWRDCSLGYSNIGPYDAVEGLTQAHVKGFLDSSYTAERIVVAATGSVKHDEVVALAANAFGGVKKGSPQDPQDKPYFCGADLIYRNDEMGPTAYVSIGWESVPFRSPDAVTFMVMQHVIGSYKKNTGLVPGTISGNRVVNAVANKMGVGCADEFEAFNRQYKDTGMFGFYVACDEVAVEHAVGELMFGCNMLSCSVTDEEVARGKRELKQALLAGSESSAAACNELGTHMHVYGRSIPLAEWYLRIEAVDAEEVRRVAWKYLNDNEIAITALGPLHGLMTYYELRQMTNTHRY